MESLPTTPVESGELAPAPFELSIEQDAEWFAALSNGKQLDEETLQRANDLIAIGSQSLHNKRTDEILQSEVFKARKEFVGTMLGWDDAGHPLHDSYKTFSEEHRRITFIMPLSTMGETWRTIHNAGGDLQHIIKKAPGVLGLTATNVQAKIDNYSSLSLNAISIMNGNPNALCSSIEKVRQRVAEYQSIEGLNAVDCINKEPFLLAYGPEIVHEKIAHYASFGLDAITIINKHPRLLSFSIESVSQKIANLDELGIDLARVILKAPELLDYAPQTLRENFANFIDRGFSHDEAVQLINADGQALRRSQATVNRTIETLSGYAGLNTPKVLIGAPQAFGMAPESIHEKMSVYKDNDLDGIKIINTHPGLLKQAPPTTQSRINLLKVQANRLGWAGKINELVEAFPSALTASETKIKADAQFAAEYGDESWREASINDVMSFMILPLHSHVSAIVNHLQTNEPYDNKATNRMRYQRKPSERRGMVLTELSDSQTRRKLTGGKVLECYFANQPVKPEELKLHPYLAEFVPKV